MNHFAWKEAIHIILVYRIHLVMVCAVTKEMANTHLAFLIKRLNKEVILNFWRIFRLNLYNAPRIKTVMIQIRALLMNVIPPYLHAYIIRFHVINVVLWLR